MAMQPHSRQFLAANNNQPVHTAGTAAVGKYALSGLLPKEQEDALFEFFDACSLVWRKVVLRSDIPTLDVKMKRALARLEIHFPCSIMYIKTHTIVHMVSSIDDLGPLYSRSMFPYERSYKKLREWIKNNRYPVASLVKNVVAFMMSVLYTNKQDNITIAPGTARLFGVPDANSGTSGEALSDMTLSPYCTTECGDWSIQTGLGRRTKQPPAVTLNNSTDRADHMLLHHLFYEANSKYRDLFDEYMQEHLGTIPISEHPQQTDLTNGEQAYLYHKWGPQQMLTALQGWRSWGIQYAGRLSLEERLMCSGPPTSYLPKYEITIGGQHFRATTAPLSNLVALRDSVVLRGIHTLEEPLHFGILREIRMFKSPGAAVVVDGGAAVFNQPVLVVEWLDMPPAGQRFDPSINVPVLRAVTGVVQPMARPTVAATFPSARFVHAQDIVPMSHMLAPAFGRSTSTTVATRMLVLNRDPNTAQLALFSRKFRSR